MRTVILMTLALGCGKDAPSELDADTDTDADSDTDSDTDTDADSDTDTDADSDTDTDTGVGWAVQITGDSAWVSGDLDELGPGVTVSTFSFSFWASADGTPTSGAGMIGAGPASAGGLRMYWSTETGSPTAAISAGATAFTARAPVLDYAAWHHIAGVYDGPADRLAVYVDGVLGEAIAPGQTEVDVDGLFLGRFYDGAGLRFQGRLDEVAVYSTALSDTEIATLAADRRVPARTAVPTGLLAYWSMGDEAGGAGTTSVDAVSGSTLELLDGATFVPAD